MKVKQRVGWLCHNGQCLAYHLATLTHESQSEIDRKVEEMRRGAQACCPKCGKGPPTWQMQRGRLQLAAEPTEPLPWEPRAS